MSELVSIEGPVELIDGNLTLAFLSTRVATN